eukprot:g3224.t1
MDRSCCCLRQVETPKAMDLLVAMRTHLIYPDVVCYNIAIDGLSNDDKLSIEEMLTLSSKIVDDMTKEGTSSNTLTYCAMINVFLNMDQINEAFGFLDDMTAFGIRPNEVTSRTFMVHFIKT